jgi:hypothetical protein
LEFGEHAKPSNISSNTENSNSPSPQNLKNRCKIDTICTHIQERSLSWLGSGSAMKNGWA